MRIQLNQDETLENKYKEYDRMLETLGVSNLEKHILVNNYLYSKYKTDWIKDVYKKSLSYIDEDGFYVQESKDYFDIIYFCEKCGMEFYGRWVTVDLEHTFYSNKRCHFAVDKVRECEEVTDLQNRINKETEILHQNFWKNEAEKIKDIAGREYCICCGKKLSKEPWNYVVNYVPRELKSLIPELKRTDKEVEGKFVNVLKRKIQCSFDIVETYERLRDIRDKKELEFAEEKVENYSASCNLPVIASVEAEKVALIKCDTDKLKEYILNLIKLEMNIYSLEKRLPQLYYHKNEYDRSANFAMYYPMFEQRQDMLQEVSKAENDYSNCMRMQTQYQMGQFPMRQPIAPSEPILKTPGVFNKKKIMAENEILQENYNKEMDKYKEELQQYECEKQQMLSEAEDNTRKAKVIWEEARKKTDSTLASLPEVQLDSSLPEVQYKEIMDKELGNAETTLKKLYQCRNEMYSWNIVFDKYRNPVALATFYEYLMAGRCSSLEGADGAYNIYEQEIRADRIIDQLGVIIKKLEDIKSNQYMIYNELRAVNQNLERLNKTAESIDTSVKNIEETAEVIAYNTAVAAYYSKMNAELTNSLGFMMALNG